MLCLGRKPNEQITIILPDGGEITLTVCKVRHEQVRLGIEAESDVVVVRTELLTRAKAAEAAHDAPQPFARRRGGFAAAGYGRMRMRTKKLRKHICDAIDSLATREHVPEARRLRQLRIIGDRWSAAVDRLMGTPTPSREWPDEPGNCETCGRVLRESDGAVCDVCSDKLEVCRG